MSVLTLVSNTLSVQIIVTVAEIIAMSALATLRT
jgi:hypothetical protein